MQKTEVGTDVKEGGCTSARGTARAPAAKFCSYSETGRGGLQLQNFAPAVRQERCGGLQLQSYTAAVRREGGGGVQLPAAAVRREGRAAAADCCSCSETGNAACSSRILQLQ